MHEKGQTSAFAILAVLLVVIIPIVLLKGSLLEFSPKNIKVSTSSLTSDTCVGDREKILKLISDFEKFQQNRDVAGVFSLFTKASTQEEVVILQDLKGIPNEQPAKLYAAGILNYKTLGYEIVTQPEESNDQTCLTVVEEKRSFYTSSPTPKWDETSTPYKFLFTLKKENGNWLVHMYEAQAPGMRSGKYSGFLLETLPD